MDCKKTSSLIHMGGQIQSRVYIVYILPVPCSVSTEEARPQLAPLPASHLWSFPAWTPSYLTDPGQK